LLRGASQGCRCGDIFLGAASYLATTVDNLALRVDRIYYVFFSPPSPHHQRPPPPTTATTTSAARYVTNPITPAAHPHAKERQEEMETPAEEELSFLIHNQSFNLQ